jgi:NADP-dependent 3-hydroxy acid dehydrogenase YdfG
VVVTGASSGIGAATVRLFRSRGWDVVGVARRTDRLEALAAETGADVFTADLTDQAQVDALRDHLAALGPIHALVNNAGGAFGMASVEDSVAEDWARMFDVNVVAVKRVTSALLPLLRAGATDPVDEARAGGDVPHADILTVTSIAGHIAYEGGGGYNASKFAAHSLVAVLRLELAGEPIRVLEVAPGMVKTDEFSLVRFGGDRARADAVYDNVSNPLSAEDIAEAIVHSIELPGFVNLDLVTIKPVAQAAPHKVIRGELKPRS